MCRHVTILPYSQKSTHGTVSKKTKFKFKNLNKIFFFLMNKLFSIVPAGHSVVSCADILPDYWRIPAKFWLWLVKFFIFFTLWKSHLFYCHSVALVLNVPLMLLMIFIANFVFVSLFRRTLSFLTKKYHLAGGVCTI